MALNVKVMGQGEAARGITSMTNKEQSKLRWQGVVPGRKCALAAGAVVVVWGGMYWGLPGLIAQQLQSQASQALGRAVTVRSVDVAPWSLSVTVHGLEVAGLPGQAPALSVERSYINASLTSLLRMAPVLDAIELDQPVVRVTQAAPGHWDFDDVIAHLQSTAQPDDPNAAPARFALYNIQVRDGRVELDDQVAGVQHKIEALQLQLPFISTLASQREVKVEPQLSMRLNGSEIATQAVGTPFESAHRTQAKLVLQQLDLAPYAAYVPASLPVRLQAGQVDADIQVAFEHNDQAVVQLQGSTLQLSGLKLQDSSGQELGGWGKLRIALGDTRPLQQQVRLASVRLEQPYGAIHRHANGQFLPNAVVAPSLATTDHPSSTSGKGAAGAGWKLLIDQFDLENGAADWRDDVGQVGAVLRMDQLQLQVRNLAWPMVSDAQWQLRANLQGEDRAVRGSVRSWGQGTWEQGQTALVVDQFDAQAVQAYVKQWLRVPVGGLASLTAGVAWQGGQVHAQLPSLRVEAVALGQKDKPELAWTGLQLRNMHVDAHAQKVQVEHVALEAPIAKVQRNAQGRWMYEQWLHPVVGAPGKGAETVTSKAGKPWQVQVQDMELAAGQVELTDASLGALPLAVKLSDVQLRMHNVDSVRGTAHAKLSARMAERTRRGGWGKPGALSYDGQLQLDPLLTKGRIHIEALPLQAFEPYMAPYLNVRLVRALASFDGDIQFAQQAKGPQVQLQGQGRVTDVHVQTVEGDVQAAEAVQGSKAVASLGAEDLLRWKSLRLQGVRVHMQPAQPPRIQVRSTDLQDFYARVVVLPQGRLNLQNLVKSDGTPDVAAQEGAVAHTLPQPDAMQPVSANGPVIEMGPIALRGGVIKFSDYFIQPNYTADLTALNGSLAAFSSQPAKPGVAPSLATLKLDGVAQGTAQLEIDGEINPLAQPLALNVRAQVKGLDLSPLTPYAIKYAGHGIEKGKLSMDVRYEVQPDGQLTASNQLVLNQLTFSDPVQGAPTSLPVRLAVALLADSRGVIDLNLPISGSLNDPQFRIAPLVFKVIGNIIRKAVTAPFSLLTGALASSDDKSDIEFDAGQAILNTQAQANLQQLAKAMQDKTQLKLTLMGQADPSSEVQGWKEVRLAQMVAGQDGPGEEVKPIGRTDAQQLAALKQVYRKVVKDKPRNMVGLSKDLPAQEMQALILQNMVIPDSAWEELAIARAQTVRDYLLSQGVDAQRVFLGRTTEKTSTSAAASVLLNISVQ